MMLSVQNAKWDLFIEESELKTHKGEFLDQT